MSKGFSSLIILLFLPVILGILFLTFQKSLPLGIIGDNTSLINTYHQAKSNLSNIEQKVSTTTWQFNSNSWQAIGTPPACPEPLVIPSPVMPSLATGILYPGQIRGGDYKPHGGFRFDNRGTNNIDVYAPITAKLTKSARYLESGEVQYLLFFINDCGIMYKLDHMLVLTDKFDNVLNKIPLGAEGISKTTEINPPVLFEKGELIATKVGLENSRNIFFDFGVYDLRQKNDVKLQGEFAPHAICWLDYLEEPDKSIIKNLPAGGIEGKQSDYCK